mmetsp:Transcript_43328/g.110859  ORF Transcript_43328/g.110859 Transcript_43328/m.110859 type:complete len:223 (+) Transcript_43328:650-1318(+)
MCWWTLLTRGGRPRWSRRRSLGARRTRCRPPSTQTACPPSWPRSARWTLSCGSCWPRWPSLASPSTRWCTTRTRCWTPSSRTSAAGSWTRPRRQQAPCTWPPRRLWRLRTRRCRPRLAWPPSPSLCTPSTRACTACWTSRCGRSCGTSSARRCRAMTRGWTCAPSARRPLPTARSPARWPTPRCCASRWGCSSRRRSWRADGLGAAPPRRLGARLGIRARPM